MKCSVYSQVVRIELFAIKKNICVAPSTQIFVSPKGLYHRKGNGKNK